MTDPLAYHDIPPRIRVLLDEVYDRQGVVLWWNARNRMLDGQRPRDADPDAVEGIAEMLADGNFA